MRARLRLVVWRIQLAVGPDGLGFRNWLTSSFAAAGIAGNTGAAVKSPVPARPAHQRPHDADKPAGHGAAGHRHAAGIIYIFFLLAPEFREAVIQLHPCGAVEISST